MGVAAVEQPPCLGKCVVPGEPIASLPETGTVRVGGGVQQAGRSLIAVKAGVVQQGPGDSLWVCNRQKRYIPNLNDAVVGDVVFCRVEEAARDLDPVLTCMDTAGKAAGFGPLKGGTLFQVSTSHARTLASGPPFLAALGRSLKFELAVGANGRVWVDAPGPANLALVARLARQAEELDAAGAVAAVKEALASGLR
ncbi:Putative exosome complex component rrp40 [Auxenochlorella protothecoides]|uniref:Putative exosome complex component rrp40 n=1 Tax=Auxenochlorella protothecoides TaxID=3075 RepID=A0A087S9M4_AUXPR|nr:Putative exosome complex component rrp40 [Auxenochlorella protothecoides]KFM22428.1 Putative exosome complex component rrp40 [Auxenochlorella protothecoides]